MGISKSSDFETHLNQYDVLYLDIAWFISNAENIRNTVKDLQLDVIEELREAFAGCIENYGGDILLVGINYDTKSKKHECIIEKYQR